MESGIEMLTKKDIENWFNLMMEDSDFETFLEMFDLTTYEIFDKLMEEGYIDEEQVKEYMRYS